MERATKMLTVVIPVYYNAGSLAHLFTALKGVERELDARGVGLELVFVNDGSRDSSLEELLKIKHERPATKIISLTRNFGTVAANKIGFKFVTGDAFAVLAADMQDPPEQLLPMVEKWLEGRKFVVSARASRKDPVVSLFFSRLYYLLLEWLVTTNYPRGGYDMMLMDKIMLPYMNSSAKHTITPVYAFWLGFPPYVLHHERRKRLAGRSRFTFRKKVNFLVDSISGFSTAPIRILSVFGMAVAIVSFLYAADIVINALLGRFEIRGFATLAALISFFCGLILFMLGMLGEYLWRVFDAVNNMPEAVIDETFL
jgi:glycosyltransferase involved in cell wall biosynthesis